MNFRRSIEQSKLERLACPNSGFVGNLDLEDLPNIRLAAAAIATPLGLLTLLTSILPAGNPINPQTIFMEQNGGESQNTLKQVCSKNLCKHTVISNFFSEILHPSDVQNMFSKPLHNTMALFWELRASIHPNN